ncbi:CDK8 kinase-activating protein cyclin C [Ceraceosorus bombacis]|uniref:CDK8 kinase-activating protein cyclin C n=1 Tax=Ceraceosorus bombacis TaxID=401625 RepID=A0A0P1BG17_9BASI|nr:CDK8 kinase-activating protein cyclin C [Ceraceosorus bombacis]
MASDYWLSSQCNHWLFTRSQLITARAEDLRYADSSDDVAAIGIWICNAIAALTKRLSQRQRVTATACIFFRRFYAKIGNSYCSTDPAMVATACFYIAAKIEETPVHVRVVASEAAKLWSELGHPSFPSDVSSLGQMEFYLLEDLDFHLIVHHPYRVLLTFSNNVGKIALSKLDDDFSGSIGMDLNTHTAGKEGLGLGLGMDVESEHARLGDAAKNDGYASTFSDTELKAWEADRAALTKGDDGQPIARLPELDDAALQYAWFVLNDTYRTDIGLLYPPHLIAIAALYLGFTLHQPSRDSLVASAEKMRERRRKWAAAAAALSNPSNQDSESVGGSELAEQYSGSGSGPSAQTPNAHPSSAGSSPIKPSNLVDSPRASTSGSSLGATSAAPRGLASLPARPAHLPAKPGSYHTLSSAGPTSSPRASATGNLLHGTSDTITGQSLGLVSSPAGTLNVDFRLVAEVVQHILAGYEVWHRIDHASTARPEEAPQSHLDDLEDGKEKGATQASTSNGSGTNSVLSDGPAMFAKLHRMRERRRLELNLLNER